jgi:hypothetical protein
MSYAVLRIEKCKTLAAVGSRAAHNLREHERAAPHADPGKRSKNVVLVGPKSGPEAVTQAVRDRLATVPKVRSNAVLAVEVVMTASPEFFTDKHRGPEDWRAWQDASMQWARDTFGADNIVSAVLHRDEKTPHIQFLFTPVHEGKLRASHWLDGPKKLSQLQDGYAKRLESLRLRRGERGSKAKHTTLREFYRLAAQIVKTVTNAPPKAPKLPERGLLGTVRADDWAKLKTDLERFGAEGARLRAQAIAGRLLADSSIGQEAAKRLAEAEAALTKVEDDLAFGKTMLGKLRDEYNTLSQVVKERKEEAQQLQTFIDQNTPADRRKGGYPLPPQDKG